MLRILKNNHQLKNMKRQFVFHLGLPFFIPVNIYYLYINELYGR